MKNILAPTEQADHMAVALGTALLLARQLDAYIEGFALRESAAGIIDMDSGGSLLAESIVRQNREAEQECRRLFETFMQEQQVPAATGSRGSLSWGWLAEAPEGNQFLGSYGRVFDLTVLGRGVGERTSRHMAAFEAALFESGHPVLLVPPTPVPRIGSNVLIAWNCSTEQARATAFAMPLLRRAQQVTVLTIEGGSAVPGPSAEQLGRQLRSHGIVPTLRTVGLEGRSTGEAILANAKALGADLLVKGAYTQSRLRQMIFGGATRHIVTHATLPVLLAS
jgi:nucleotide-binding universal stress UspA family protein